MKKLSGLGYCIRVISHFTEWMFVVGSGISLAWCLRHTFRRHSQAGLSVSIYGLTGQSYSREEEPHNCCYKERERERQLYTLCNYNKHIHITSMKHRPNKVCYYYYYETLHQHAFIYIAKISFIWYYSMKIFNHWEDLIIKRLLKFHRVMLKTFKRSKNHFYPKVFVNNLNMYNDINLFILQIKFYDKWLELKMSP